MSPKRTLCAIAALAILSFGISAFSDEISKMENRVKELSQQTQILRKQYLKDSNYKIDQYVSGRLIDGENFYRTKDYQRAAVIFMDIIENYSDHPEYLEALYLYADSLFMRKDYRGAIEWFQRVLEEDKSKTGSLDQKAAERLVEIGIHLGNFDGMEEYIEKLSKYSSPESSYIRAKYLYFKGDLDNSINIFKTVQGNDLLVLKAQYMKGVILTRQAKYDQAIEVFNAGKPYSPKTKEESNIVDLMNLGAGRLYFERGDAIKAAEAYQRIAENSSYFDTALYEAASVLIMTGDAIRAEQTLEVLTVAMPDSKYIPRAKMLRGNLLLRTGQYDEAEKVFDEVIAEFTPVTEQLTKVIDRQNSDTRSFFNEIVEKNLETLDTEGLLPPLVVKWVSEETEVKRALNVAQDITIAKENMVETERLLTLLEAVIDGPSSVNAVPSMKQAMRKGQQISNQLTVLRYRLLEITENSYAKEIPALAAMATERAALGQQVARLPIEIGQFTKREAESSGIYTKMHQDLSQNEIRIDQMSAMIVAIERFISDSRYGGTISEDRLEIAKQELNRYRQAVNAMQSEVEELKIAVESGQYRVGIGDADDRKDIGIRNKIKKLTGRERNILRSINDDKAKRASKIHKKIDEAESIAFRFRKDVEEVTFQQVAAIREKLRREKASVADYDSQLRLLTGQAEEVVGGVAFENFSNVKKRFHDLVLKADVGIIDVAWLKKEERSGKISDLTKSRLNEIKSLDDDFQQVTEAEEK